MRTVLTGRHQAAWLAMLLPGALLPASAAAQAVDDAYLRSCAPCHAADLRGGETGPALIGEAFSAKWSGLPDGILERFTRGSMPPTNPGGLAPADYAAAVARIRAANGFSAAAPDVASAAPPAPTTQWLHHRGDAGSSGYSPLAQVNRDNVRDLRIAWRWKSDNFGPTPESYFRVTSGFRLVALDAATGRPVPGFGTDGIVDVVIVGAAFAAGGAPRSKTAIPGYVRAFDLHSGALRWTFRTIPAAGEYGRDTWEDGSADYTGNTGVWSPFSADAERGLVYLPVEAPTGDFYGGHRPGANLFADSLVCLDARTGQRLWHFQTIHHDIWDYDLPAPPVLLDITVRGRRVPAVAQVTKTGFTFVFDRVTGKPVWPIHERAVPQSDVPGERTSRTQPFPSLPAPFEAQGLRDEDLIDFTPEMKRMAREIIGRYRYGPLYLPPSVVVEGGNLGTLVRPNLSGGANWAGAAADPETGMLYVSSLSTVGPIGLRQDQKLSDMTWIGAYGEGFPRGSLGGPFGLPLLKPPWGRITAIDLNSGRHAWMVPNADTPEWARTNPALAGIDLPRTGSFDQSGLLVTRSLLFSGEGGGLWRAGGGKQYIVVAVGARGSPGELVALALP